MIDLPKILLIEDDSAIADGLQRVLGRNGYEVTVLLRGDEGLKQAGRDHFDVVLTDFKLPGLSGLELVAQLHAEAAGRVALDRATGRAARIRLLAHSDA